MPFQITWENRPNAFGLDEHVAVLSDADNRLEVWPALGCNAYRWNVGGQEMLYRSPEFFTDHRPTRSGFPILFPFPNRIRAGQFAWAGRTYQLPLGDPAKQNAIHGFVVQRPWRIIDQGADASSAWITGEFHGAADAPETLALWPADYRLRVTYRLGERILRVEAIADNPGATPLPFGIGYHPYFQLTPFGGAQAVVTVGADKLWELSENLPTGRILDVDKARDLRQGQTIASVQLDDVMTGLHPFGVDRQANLQMLGMLQHPTGERLLTLWASPDFRDMVMFTPPHREAICLEPYTCVTDAINLSQRGIDSGLRILRPGDCWQGTVEMHVSY